MRLRRGLLGRPRGDLVTKDDEARRSQRRGERKAGTDHAFPIHVPPTAHKKKSSPQFTMKSKRRHPIPLQPRRQRGLAVACIALLTPLLRVRSRRKCYDREVDGESCWPMWLTSSLFAHAESTSPTNQQREQQHSSDGSDDSTTKISRPLNYYELLNLEAPDTHRRPRTNTLHNRKKRTTYRSKIATSDVKKAYRKQAQIFHPDKVSRHNKNVTTEEANSRFAEIAEAYQVLVDPAQRYDYDWELLEMEEEHERDRLLIEEEQRELRKQEGRPDKYEGRHHDGNQNVDKEDDFSLYDKIRNGASNFHAWKDTLNLDPWAVFEDFFFQDSTAEDDRHHHQEDARYPNSYNDASYYESNPSQPNRPPPPAGHARIQPRVSETTVYRGYDYNFGADLYTVLRREEYIQNSNYDGKYYYKILGQDFISGTRVDPYTGFTMQEYYSAVTEPYFVEEGYSKPGSKEGGEKSDHEDANLNFLHQQDRHKTQRHEAAHRTSQSKLVQEESFTPRDSDSDPWISPNGNYRAVLTATCELQIVRHDDRQNQGQPSSTTGDNDIADTVIWSSDTYIPNSRARGCHLTLNSFGSLVLSVDYGSGLDSVGNTVLWDTPLPPVVPHWSHDEDFNAKQRPVTFKYHASLDDDGVIAIYRVREKERGGADSGEHKVHPASPDTNTPQGERDKYTQIKLQIRPMIYKLSVMYHRVSMASLQQGQTKAAFAWDQLRYKVGWMLSGRPWTASTPSTEDGLDIASQCIFATSPAGCLAPGRNAIHLSRKIARSIQLSVRSMDSYLDRFLSALTEPASEYDYDEYGNSHNSNGGYESNYSHVVDDEDEDLLDTLLRVTGAASAQLGKAGIHGIHAAQLKLKQGKKIAGKMVGKMKKRVGTHSVQWGERMTEKAEVDSFF